MDESKPMGSITLDLVAANPLSLTGSIGGYGLTHSWSDSLSIAKTQQAQQAVPISGVINGAGLPDGTFGGVFGASTYGLAVGGFCTEPDHQWRIESLK